MSDIQFPAKPGGCEEAVMPFQGMTKAFSCNAPAKRNIGWPRRKEGPYRMCEEHAHHSVRNRGAADLGEYLADLTDRSFGNLDVQILSREGCSRCNAGAGEAHTFPCANMIMVEAKS